MLKRLMSLLAAGLIAGVSPGSSRAQIPDTFENLQVLDEDISRDSLLTVMRGFSFALGVRCTYCHVPRDSTVDPQSASLRLAFDRDDDPDKRKARFMLQMVERLNNEILTEIPERDDPPVRMECKSCHRGQPKPVLLKHELRAALDAAGPDSAATFYRTMREEVALGGYFDFGQWETNTLAEELQREGRPHDAIAIYELNREYYPESASIHFNLGGLYEEVGDIESALESYRRTVELNPNFQAAQRRIEALEQ